MKVLYFDCFSGTSGDMTLGALVDLGVDSDFLKSELEKLNLDGYEIAIKKKVKCGITGTDVQVILKHEHSHDEEIHDGHHSHHHIHNHQHEHNHLRSVEDNHHGHDHLHLSRNLKDIEHMIDTSNLDNNVKDFSKRVFREIAKAEARVHNKDIYEVHFHEVGAIDSIVDIVGVGICINILGVEKIFSSAMHDGSGFIQCKHGKMPVPVPAVMEMLKESRIPLITEDVNTELVTPTGIGIIKCLSDSFGKMPDITVDKVGYGMGKRETGGFNALRIVMGELVEKEAASHEIVVLETNIDDMSPELLGYTMERLLESGALDVYHTPVYMKKNRPAVMLTVLADREQEEKLVDIILKETSTLGIRRSMCQRYCMERKIVKVNTQYGEARVKVCTRGDIKKFSPEYEDCRQIAKKTGLPLDKIFDEVRKSMG